MKKGSKHSVETIRKISVAVKGEKNPMYGVKNFGEDNPFFGKKHSSNSKKLMSDSRRNERSYSWKGDNTGYRSLHFWIRKNKPKPKFCEDCHIKPPKDVATLIGGVYKRDINMFKWLCASCHLKLDYRLGVRKPRWSK